MNITPDRVWAVVAILGGLLALRLTWRGRVAWQHAHAVDDFAAADNSTRVYEGDQYRQLQDEIARDRMYDTRTISQDSYREHLAGLVDDVPSALEADDYITGQIVKASDLPPAETDLTTQIMSRLDEFRTTWHWVGGELHPPTGLVDALPREDWLEPGEPDWLLALLQPELVAA